MMYASGWPSPNSCTSCAGAHRYSGIIASLRAVRSTLGRPRVDTLSGSRQANMKELRFNAADGEWGAASAFDILPV
jgi:hypothetical protein